MHHLERGHRHGHGSRLSAAAEIDPGRPIQIPRVHQHPKVQQVDNAILDELILRLESLAVRVMEPFSVSLQNGVSVPQ
jgi:hypothetical protein